MREPYLETGFVRLCFEKLFSLIILNLLFVLSCVPVLTIPAAIAALTSACQASLMDDKQIYRKFWKSFRANFLQSLPIGAVFVIGPMAVLYGCLVYYQLSQGEGASVILSFFCFICIYLLFSIGVFAFQMLARVELKTKAIVKNAVYLTFQYPKLVLGWILLAFVINMAGWGLFPYSFPWLLLLGASLPCFAATRGVLPVINTTIVKE